MIVRPFSYRSEREICEGSGGKRTGVVARNGIGKSIGRRVAEETHTGGFGRPSTVVILFDYKQADRTSVVVVSPVALLLRDGDDCRSSSDKVRA